MDRGPDYSPLGFSAAEQAAPVFSLTSYNLFFFFFKCGYREIILFIYFFVDTVVGGGGMVGCFIATGTLEKLKSLAIFSRGYFPLTQLILCPGFNYLQPSRALCQPPVAVTRSG